MPLILRQLRRGNDWRRPEWLRENEVPADALNSFDTQSNSLSLWTCDDAEKTQRTVTALAANRQVVDVLDYVVFDSEVLEASSLSLRRTRGKLPDPTVNDWHLEAFQLTAAGRTQLVAVAWKHARKERVQKRRVAELIALGIKEGRIDRTGLSDEIVKHLKERSLL